MSLQPIHDHVLLEELPLKSIEGGLIVEEEEESNWGKVIYDDPAHHLLKEGCTVLFKRHLFDRIQFDGKDYLIGKRENIIAVVQ